MAGDTTKLVFELFGRDNASPVFDKFGRRVRTTGDDLDAFGRKAQGSEKHVLGLKSAFMAAAPAVAALGLGAVAKDSVQLEAQFSKTMSQVRVQTKASASEMASLDALALQMGADTVFSAGGASDAMLELAKGGLNEAEIKSGALKSTMTLAAAGTLELGEAAGNVVDTMGAFELKAKDTDAAVAALAGSANASSADVSDMTQALSQVGAQAHATGLSVEETTAFLAALANAGIKGSDAGTGLKTMLQLLQPTTKKQTDLMKELNLSFVDGQGNFVSAVQIAGRLQTAFKGMSQAERASTMTKLFGSDASRAANILTLQGADGIRKYIKATSDKNAAEELAKTSMEGTSGALEQMSGAIETAEIRFGKALAPAVQDAAAEVSDFVENASIEEWTEGAIDGLKEFGDTVGPIASNVLPAVTDAAGGTLDVLQLLAPIVGDVADAFGALPESVQQAILLGAAVSSVSPKFQGFGSSAGDALMNLRTMPDEMRKTHAKAIALKGGVGAAGIGMSMFADEIGTSNEALGQVAGVLGAAATGFAVGGPWGAAVGGGIGLLQAFGGANKNAVPDVDALTSSLDKQTGMLTGNTTALLQNALEKDGAYKKARKMGVNLGDVTDAAAGDKGAMARIKAQRDAEAKRQGAQAEKMSPGSGSATEEGIKRNFDELTDSISAQSGAVAEARQKWENLNDSQRQSKSLNKVSAEQIRAVAKATEGIPRRIISKFTTPGYEGAAQNAVDLARKYKLTPKQVRTTLKALDYSSADIRKVMRLMKQADASRANPKIDVDTGGEEAKLRRLQGIIDGMHGKSVHVAVTGGGGGITRSADGNILFFANGGTHDIPNGHEPMIATPGDTRFFNEPETAGEAYIPFAPAKRARSQALTEEVAERLGGVAFFADGGTRGKPKSKPRSRRKRKAKVSELGAFMEVPDAITVEDLANADMDESISAYDAVGRQSWTDWANGLVEMSRRQHDRDAAEVKAAKKAQGRTQQVEAGVDPRSVRSRSSASQRSADRRRRGQQLEGTTVRVVDSNGRSMRGTIRTRG
jgi:TP901 family phage tail tape measure protein